MFSTLVGKLERGPYRFNAVDYGTTKLLRCAPLPAMCWVAVLFVEEVFDAIQRRSVPDETIQPIARQVFKIHVAEEARHIRYAREELSRTMPQVGRGGRESLALTIGIGLGLINRALTNPEMYADAGLDARQAVAAANTSVHRREFLSSTVRRALPFFNRM